MVKKKTTNPIIRIDRDLINPDNIISLKSHYGDFYEIINDIGCFLSYKIQNQGIDLFNEYSITIKEFCLFSKRTASNIGRKIRDEEGNVIVAGSIKDKKGNKYVLDTVIEHALFKMTQPVLLSSLSKYRDSVSVKFQNFNFIDGFEVIIPNKRTKERHYKLFLNKVFFGALLKSFANLNKPDFLKIKGKNLYPLYMYLSNLKTTAELQSRNNNNSKDVVSSPYFELLKKVCNINSEKPSYVKQKIEEKIIKIQKDTTLDFKYTWTKTDSMRFPYQLHIFWEYETIPKDKLEILYKQYNESYYDFLLKEHFDKYNDKRENKITYPAWFNLEETKKIKVNAFVDSYNFINNKNITVNSEIVFKKFGVLDSYINKLKYFYKNNLKADYSKFNKWFEYISKNKSNNYKSTRIKFLNNSIKDKLGYSINNETVIFNELLKVEKIIKLKK